ncbi:MAG: zinc-binding dehydrogenase [Acidimicrobiales bacterium]
MPRAAVLVGTGQPLEIRGDLEVAAPAAGEVLVRMAASGVCHSDLSARDGDMLVPTPVVLGHEGAGVVEAVGPGVTAPALGDHVVVGWLAQCGRCFFCVGGQAHLCERATTSLASGAMSDGTTRLRSQGAPLFQMGGAGTFAELAVVAATATVAVDRDLDLGLAALLGCAVITGTGAALRTARIEPGAAVAVIGCGGVGLNVIQGARIAGAARIIALDAHREKLELAAAFGATDAVDVTAGDAVSAVMALTGQRGADVAFEVVGIQRTIDQAIAMTRRGGQAVLVGVPALDVVVNVPAFFGLVLAAKTVAGCWYGSSTARDEVPRLVALYRSGQLLLDELVSQTVELDGVNDALERLRAGSGARTIIRHRS